MLKKETQKLRGLGLQLLKNLLALCSTTFFLLISLSKVIVLTVWNSLSFLERKSPRVFWGSTSLLLLVVLVVTRTGVIVSSPAISPAEKAVEKIESSGHKFGIDISHYQGNINWEKVKKSHHPIEFVIARSTMGKNGRDKKYLENVRNAREKGYVVGAYHYYRPNEHSADQAKNFIKHTKLYSGDIIPVLDIENLPKVQSKARLREGLKNWLRIVERQYGVKPMIYTSQTYWEDYLRGCGFDGYPLWIAAYSSHRRQDQTVKDAHMHQFTEQVRISGISYPVDGNDLKSFDGILLP